MPRPETDHATAERLVDQVLIDVARENAGASYLGQIMAVGNAERMFVVPKLPLTQSFITGRFG